MVVHAAAVMLLFPAAKSPRHHQHGCPGEQQGGSQGSRVLKSLCSPIPGLVESKPRAHCRCCSAPRVRMSREGVCRQHRSLLPQQLKPKLSEEDEQDGRMQLHGESGTLRRLATQMGPVALGLDVNTSSLISFSNRIF